MTSFHRNYEHKVKDKQFHFDLILPPLEVLTGLFPASAPCFELFLSIVSLAALRDVGGWNRLTSRALSVDCVRDVTDRDVLLSRP